jgi:hypothetical protein
MWDPATGRHWINGRWVEPVEMAMGREQRAKEAGMELNAGTKDCRGRVLQVGDEVILVTPGPIFFRIASIEPSLDPRAPADVLLLQIGVMLPFVAKRGAINLEFIRVRTAQEAGPAPFEVLPPKESE